MKIVNSVVILALVVLFNTGILYSHIGFYFETGMIKSGYNDVRIPGDTGTFFSLCEELESDDGFFFRGRLNYSLNDRNDFSLLFAPLTIKASGEVDKDIQFEDENFPANTSLNATYVFNSYRLTYRYKFYQSNSFGFGLGLTGKIRDAEITLENETLKSSKTNVGFVPLVNFKCFYEINKAWGLLFMGDALAAPQGRAEDVLVAITYGKTDNFRVKAGYRLLEGGADNDEVYTFSLFHYAVLGVTVSL
jgi:hypothetical protein